MSLSGILTHNDIHLYCKSITIDNSSSSLNNYETGSFVINFTGAGILTADWNFTRIGNLVTLNIPTLTTTFVSGTTLNATASIPARLRPQSDISIPIYVIDTSSGQGGSMTITTGGDITVGPNNNLPEGFFSGSDIGFSGSSASWLTL